MTGKERWLAVLNMQKPDRIPMDYWATEEANQKLMKHLGLPDMDAVFKKLHIDRPLWVGGSYTGPTLKDGIDMWGFKRRKVEYGNGSPASIVQSTPSAPFRASLRLRVA